MSTVEDLKKLFQDVTPDLKALDAGVGASDKKIGTPRCPDEDFGNDRLRESRQSNSGAGYRRRERIERDLAGKASDAGLERAS